ncbi:MAG: carboxypeptidase-like regulatory domain-containing protein [Candidatus Bathyarchaeia archaeon]
MDGFGEMIIKRLGILIVLLSVLASAQFPVACGEPPYPQGGSVHGMVLGYDIDDKLVPLSWAHITAEVDGVVVTGVSSADGYYEMFVPGGELTLRVEHPGYISQTVTIYVSPGSSTAINFNLERSNEPIPEYSPSTLPVLMLLAILLLLLVLRRCGAPRG